MVLVYRLNRRFIQHKLAIVIVVILLIFGLIHFIDVHYSVMPQCVSHEKIDVVYTWVNGSDPEFLDTLKDFISKVGSGRTDYSKQRFNAKDELKYSLRSLEKNAPWINRVYLVTNGQIPSWLDLSYEKLRVVTHDEIFTMKSYLPTFSSPAIEAHLHRIPGLSKRFIYFNDDIFLRSPVTLDDFWSPSRGYLIYHSWFVPMCAPDCQWFMVGDGNCDIQCYNADCQMDADDCTVPRMHMQIVQTVAPPPPTQKLSNYSRLIALLDQDKTTTDPGDLHYTISGNQDLNRLLHNGSASIDELIKRHNDQILLRDRLERKRRRKRNINRVNPMIGNHNGRGNNNNNGDFKVPVDAYGKSLQYTTRVLNRALGFHIRYVPAHAPIMIEKEIMRELQAELKDHIEHTVKNRFRSISDIQFAYSYNYYLIQKKMKMSARQLFDEFDIDQDGIWSQSELRTVLTKMYRLPLTADVIAWILAIITDCGYGDKYTVPTLTRSLIVNCHNFTRRMNTTLGQRNKFKYTEIYESEIDYVAFKMIVSDVRESINHLDDVRRNEKKFVCLNDDTDPTKSNSNQEINDIMYEFYTTLFPHPSRFELPVGHRNEFLYLNQYRNAKEQREAIKTVVFVSIFSFLLVFFLMWFCSLRRTRRILIRILRY